jgi:hypothetical protein
LGIHSTQLPTGGEYTSTYFPQFSLLMQETWVIVIALVQQYITETN